MSQPSDTFPVSPTESHPHPPVSRQRTLLLVIGVLLLVGLSTRLLANRVIPSFRFTTMTPLELEEEILQLFNEGTDIETPQRIALQAVQIPYFDDAIQLSLNEPGEKFQSFMERHSRSMRPYQDLAFTAMFVLRRYDTPETFERVFATIAQMDPQSETGKKAAFLQQLERSKSDSSISPDERELLFAQLSQWVEAEKESKLLRYMAGVICGNHGRSKDGYRYYEPLIKEWEVGPQLLRRDYGDLLQKLGRTYDAMSFCRQTVKHFPTGENYSLLALAYRDLNLPRRALDASYSAIKISPDDAAQWATRTRILCRCERFNDAIVAAKKTLSLDQTNESGWYYQASALEGLDQPKDAVEVLREGLKIVPGNRSLLQKLESLQAFDSQHANYRNSTQTPHRQGKLLTSHHQLESRLLALYAACDHQGAQELVRREWRKLKTFPRAIQYAKRKDSSRFESFATNNREQLNAELDIAFLYGVELRTRFDTTSSQDVFRLIGKLAPETTIGELAQVIFELENTALDGALSENEIDDRLNILEEQLRAQEASPLALWLGGMACRSLEKPKQGVKFYERLSEYWSPGPALMHQTYANHLDDLYRHSEALIHRRITATLQHGAWAVQGYAYTLNEQGRYTEAFGIADKSILTFLPNSGIWGSVGYSGMKLGRHKQAIENFKMAIRIDQYSERPWIHWARSLCSLDRPTDAHQLLQLASQYFPENKEIAAELDALSNYASTSGTKLSLIDALESQFD